SPPLAAISSTTSLAASGERVFTTTRAPASASAWACARPRPRPPPAATPTRPASGASPVGTGSVTARKRTLRPMEFDPLSADFFDDPYDTYRWLRDEAPVHHNDRYGFWALSRFADVVAAHRD